MNQDIYFNFLLNANVDKLILYCQSNTLMNQLCHDPYFWQQKYQHDNIPEIEPIYTPELKNFYWNVTAIETFELLDRYSYIFVSLNDNINLNHMKNFFQKINN